jgi:hypothetical protein
MSRGKPSTFRSQAPGLSHPPELVGRTTGTIDDPDEGGPQGWSAAVWSFYLVNAELEF